MTSDPKFVESVAVSQQLHIRNVGGGILTMYPRFQQRPIVGHISLSQGKYERCRCANRI